MHELTQERWDIFCRVVDNYGDIGVCWRIARQLAQEYPFQVRLWVDEINALVQIWPSVQSTAQQIQEGVEICQWAEDFPQKVEPAQVVIESFACNIPESYLLAMKQAKITPKWFNLEYLSAEDWVEGCHQLSSMHPQLGLKKTFYFPGFTSKTGGLIREQALFKQRDIFQASPLNKFNFLASIGVKAATNDLLISLFGYENTSIESLIDAWASSKQPVLCLIPQGKILSSVNTYINHQLNAGDVVEYGNLKLQIIPFLTQTEYSQLGRWV